MNFILYKFFGLEESSLKEILESLYPKWKELTWEIYDQYPELHVKIDIANLKERSLRKALNCLEAELRNITGPCFFAQEDQNMEEVVGSMLIDKKITVSLAESCTGGRIGNLLTNVPGSSVYFTGGVIVYSNKAKEEILNVSEKTLINYGAVSDPTAKEMAEGVRDIFHSDLGLSVTGIAGPEGGSKDKPVGTAHIGLSSPDETVSQRYLFQGTREQVKQHSAIMALDWIRRYLNGDSFIPGI